MPSRSGPISPKNHEEPHALLSCCKVSRTLTRKTLPHSICCPPDKMRTEIWPNGPKSSHGTGTFGLDVRTLRPASSSPLSPAGIAAAGCFLRKARTGYGPALGLSQIREFGNGWCPFGFRLNQPQNKKDMLICVEP